MRWRKACLPYKYLFALNQNKTEVEGSVRASCAPSNNKKVTAMLTKKRIFKKDKGLK
jgi:hypothetical protein